MIGGKDYSLDLTEAGTDPLAGLSLATAIAKLTEALATLPDLAARAVAPTTLAFDLIAPQAVSIDFELEDEDTDFKSVQAMALTVAPKLKPLPMAPITAIDDPKFIPALKANVNLPAYVRQAL